MDCRWLAWFQGQSILGCKLGTTYVCKKPGHPGCSPTGVRSSSEHAEACKNANRPAAASGSVNAAPQPLRAACCWRPSARCACASHAPTLAARAPWRTGTGMLPTTALPAQAAQSDVSGPEVHAVLQTGCMRSGDLEDCDAAASHASKNPQCLWMLGRQTNRKRLTTRLPAGELGSSAPGAISASANALMYCPQVRWYSSCPISTTCMLQGASDDVYTTAAPGVRALEGRREMPCWDAQR
jgi:hypothetical protein